MKKVFILADGRLVTSRDEIHKGYEKAEELYLCSLDDLRKIWDDSRKGGGFGTDNCFEHDWGSFESWLEDKLKEIRK